MARRNNRGGRKAEANGILFDSQAERDRYLELMLMEKAGEISDLECQPQFELQEAFSIRKRLVRPMVYTADFMYVMGGKLHVEEVKGYATEPYRMRRKLFLKKYGEQHIFIESKKKGKSFELRVY